MTNLSLGIIQQIGMGSTGRMGRMGRMGRIGTNSTALTHERDVTYLLAGGEVEVEGACC